MKKLTLKSLIGAAAWALFSGSATAAYIATTWGDNAVHFLDNGFNNVSSFAVGQSLPNGIGTDGTNIYVGTFTDATVRIFNASGNLLGSWTAPSLNHLQGLDYMNGQIAIATGNTIEFRNAATGALNSSITGANITSSIEGIDFDGSLIWAIADSNLYGINPVTGATVSTIPNAAAACAFDGTGIAAVGANQLALVCSGGAWFLVDKATGAVNSSGNNGLDMFGLDVFEASAVPEPGTLALLAAVAPLFGLVAARRRRNVI